MGQVGVHDGQWMLIENDTAGQICDFCETRCHTYWSWWSTPTKCTTRYCIPCVAEIVHDDTIVEVFSK